MEKKFDKLFRREFLYPPTGLIRQLINAEVERVDPLPPRVQQTFPEREADTVVRVTKATGEQFLLHLEYQVGNLKKMVTRMAIYDLWLHDIYKLPVFGVVLYIGRNKITMPDTLSFANLQYSCQMIDIRSLNPDIFLKDKNKKSAIFALLTGSDKLEAKKAIIEQILLHLQKNFVGAQQDYEEIILHLDTLAQLRPQKIQDYLIKKVENMPIILDQRKSKLYSKILNEGIEKGKKTTALNFIKEGVDMRIIQKATGLTKRQLNSLMKQAASA